MKEGIINAPLKLARTLMFSLSIVMLAFFGISSSEIGIFYMTLTLSILVGSFASSMALALIPASSRSTPEISSDSLRMTLVFTTPIISILVISPSLLLSLLGDSYIEGESQLRYLAIAILPFAIVVNSVAKFNSTTDTSKILILGIIPLIVFLTSFYLLVPALGTNGASISILLAFTAPAAVAMIWVGRKYLTQVVYACLYLMSGLGAGFAASQFAGANSILTLIIAFVIPLAIALALRAFRPSEISTLIRSLTSQSKIVSNA
jgi:O-antigen/teichoic acid export membrane protein